MTDRNNASGLEGEAFPPRIVGLEEHFVVPDLLAAWTALDPSLQDFAWRASS